LKRGYVDFASGQLHYRCNQQRAGIPLVLLHQSPSDSRMYEKLMGELDDDFWMIAPDNPGFGNSDPLAAGFSLQACAEAIFALLDQLEISQCYLFGHHTGASVAVQMAWQDQQRFEKLALCGPTLLDPELKAALPGKATQFPLDPQGSHLQAMWQRLSAKEAGAPLDLLLRELQSAFSAGESYPQAYAAVAEQDFEGQLRSLSLPTLVFAGTSDILYPCLQDSYDCLAQGAIAEIEGGGSYVCERQSGLVADLLRSFFADD
jgi:haloalkane dehalogenase